MISWSYYGLKGFNFLFEKGFVRLTGKKRSSEIVFYLLFLTCIVIGSSSSLSAVIDFSDMMILGMAFPNVLGLLIFSREISGDLKDYLSRLKTGKILK